MNKTVAWIALSGLVTAPAAGSIRTAAFGHSGDSQISRPGMFAGATYRVGLDRRSNSLKGRAALNVAGTVATPGRADFTSGHGLELTGGKSGKPVVRFGGQELGELQKRAKLSSGGKIAIVAGVVALAGAVAVGVWALNASYCDRTNNCE